MLLARGEAHPSKDETARRICVLVPLFAEVLLMEAGLAEADTFRRSFIS